MLCPESCTLRLEIFGKPLYSEQRYPFDAKQCLFLGGAYIEAEDGEKYPLSELPVKQENIDPGMGIGRDYKGGRVLIEGQEYKDAIPVSPVDHQVCGILEYDLSEIKAVRLTGVLGVDNFPGEEEQRRRTYGVGQRAVCGKFITVIEPYEKEREVVTVEGLSDSCVRIFYKDKSYQELIIEGVDTEPSVQLRTYSGEVCVQEEAVNGCEK